MTTIRLTNTKIRRKEDFAPLDRSNVRMYVCGPTVYDRAHLGNARPVVVFDVLYRLLRHVYGEGAVTYVRNFTDVDDKINAEALRRQQAGAEGTLEDLIRQRTEETIAWYHADMDALGALRPTHEPRATEWIGAMIAMIGVLIEKKNAYVAEGHVLFAVDSYPAYGALSGRTVEDMIAGARVEVAPYKRNPMDFVLWKPSGDEEPGWPSPWGRGRPGWHIECSAMARELLGDSFDIHGGGLDLQFPHHENEIAQSACAHPEGDFARVWMHNEMLLVEGRKMSKSLGNFFTVRELLDQGVPGEVIRFVMLMTHYRKPMDWTEEKAREAKATLWKWRTMAFSSKPDQIVEPSILRAIFDDLNLAQVLSILHGFAKDGNAGALLAGANLIGLLDIAGGDWFEFGKFVAADERIEEVTMIRIRARDAGRYDVADLLRTMLVEAGVAVFDNSRSSAAYFEPSALKRFAMTQAHNSWREGNTDRALRYIRLVNSVGYSVSLDDDGPSAVSGGDPLKAKQHFEDRIGEVVGVARKLAGQLEVTE